MYHRLTGTIHRHLTTASRHPKSRLPDTVSPKILATILEQGWAEPSTGTENEAAGHVITLAGRRVILSLPQLKALTTASPDDELAPNVVWQTSRVLADLRLVHFKDQDGTWHDTDGDTGTSRPTRRPHRTDLGRQVAELTS
ncbi:MAG: hypothetical protein JO362_20995 [Streptomycetaceae bacterium]|nr:hypothetical protein [Streptomycetaceae bacterium]